ncbi:MAG: hypothetical protein ACKVPJ_02105 [Chitinophagales bacterium]
MIGRVILFCFCVTCFASCKYENIEVYELAKQTEKVQVVFTSKPEAYEEITSKKKIRQFANYISMEDTPVFHCGYDGYLLFFTENGSVRMEFNLQEDCRHILYNYAGATQTKKITPEGLEYLLSVQPK